MKRFVSFLSFAALSVSLSSLTGCLPGGGEGCTPQGACPNLGEGVTYDNCCVVGGTSCRFVFPDGHEIPYDPNSVDDSSRAIDEALAYCTGEGQGDGGPSADAGS